MKATVSVKDAPLTFYRKVHEALDRRDFSTDQDADAIFVAEIRDLLCGGDA